MDDSIYNFDALITDEQMFDLGEADLMGVQRRSTLAALTRSSSQLIDGLKDDPNFIFELIDITSNYEDFLKESLELASIAKARLIVVADKMSIDSQISKGIGKSESAFDYS